jgi:uncharacterized protein with PQ loop repeat
MEYFSIVGYFGGFLLSVQMIPQIFKVIKSHSAADLSYVYLSLNLIGLQCMAMYGIYQNEKPLYIPAGVSSLNTMMLVSLKMKYDNKVIVLHEDGDGVCQLNRYL